MKTNDFNKTEPVGTQGPLAQTLKGMERWDINEIKDSAKDGDAKIAGKGTKS